MLSISGTTLEQFADLMKGLGYNAEAGERAKVKSVTQVMPEAAKDVAADTPVMDVADQAPAGGITEQPVPPAAADVPEGTGAIIDEGTAPIAAEPEDQGEVPAQISDMSEGETPQGTAADAQIAGAEMETFYTFTWARAPRRQQNQGDRPKGKGKPNPRGKKGQRDQDKGKKSQNFSARPPKAEKKIDPDNPFAAALMGLKNDK
jgi:ATP-dependent RNA helicase SUPV3L1/SUV3